MVVGLAGVLVVTLATVFIGNEKKSTCERSMVPLVELAPISEKVQAGNVVAVTDETVGVVILRVGACR